MRDVGGSFAGPVKLSGRLQRLAATNFFFSEFKIVKPRPYAAEMSIASVSSHTLVFKIFFKIKKWRKERLLGSRKTEIAFLVETL